MASDIAGMWNPMLTVKSDCSPHDQLRLLEGVIPFLALMALVTFVRRLSAYLDSWGLSETLSVTVFRLGGIEPSMALAISLLRHAAINFASLPGGFLLNKGVVSKK